MVLRKTKMRVEKEGSQFLIKWRESIKCFFVNNL